MASRVISYVFKGDFGNLRTGLAATGKQTDDAKRKLKELEGQAKSSQKNMEAFKGGLLSSLGLGGVTGPQAIGVASAAGIAAIVGTTARFDQAMSAVQAATHETAGNMEELRQAALDAGAATVYSASESAGAIEELAKAGISTKDILGGGLNGALSLAAAGALDVGEAAEIAASAMTQFRLSGEQVPHIADLLAAGAGKAQGSVHDLGMALNQSGLVASQMGVSIEETTGTLAAFASAGLIGSDAGTSFKTMLLRLANPSAEAADTMKRLGINAYDAQGNFVGIKNLAGQLQGAFKGQSQAQRDAAMATIFGSDAIRAANVLYNDGASGIADWTSKVNDSGYAAETASIRLDNLAGDFEQLKGSIENAFIQSGEGSTSFLRELTQGATEFVNLQGPASEMGQSIVRQITGIDALSASLKQVNHWLGNDADATKKTADTSDEAAQAMATYTGALNEAGAAADGTSFDLESLVKAMQDNRKAALGAFDAVTQYGQALHDARKRAKESNAGIDASTKAGRENRQAISQLAAAWNNQSDAVRNNQGKFRQARRDFIDTATAMGVPEAAARRLAKRLLDVPNSVAVKINANTAQADSAIDHINDRLTKLNGNSANTYVYINTIQRSFNEKRAGMKQATGGPIYGPGTATSDSIPAWLSDGEYVVKAASVAKYGVAMFDALNAGHFAGGGLAGYASGGSVGIAASFGIDIDKDDSLKRQLRLFSVALEKSTTAVEKETQKRDDLTAKVNDFAGSVAGNFTHDIFGNGVSGALTQLSADTHDANAFKRALAGAAGRGLDTHGGLYQALAASGDLNTAQQLSHMSRAQIDQFEAAYARRGREVSSLTSSTSTAAFGAAMAAQVKELREAQAERKRLKQTVDRLEDRIKHIGKNVEDGARRGVGDKNKETSQRGRAGR